MKRLLLFLLIHSAALLATTKTSDYYIALSGMAPQALPRQLSRLDGNEQPVDNLKFYMAGYVAFLVHKLNRTQHQILVQADDEEAFRAGNFHIVGLDIIGKDRLDEKYVYKCQDLKWFHPNPINHRFLTFSPQGPETNSTRDWWIKFVVVQNAINTINNSSNAAQATTALHALVDTNGAIFDSVHTMDIKHTNAIRSLSGVTDCYYQYSPPPPTDDSWCIIS